MFLLSKTGVLFENFLGISGFDIYWYGVLIACGFLLAFLNTSFLCKKRNYKSDLTVDMLIIAIIGAIVGARAYYVIFQWDNYFIKGDLGLTISRIIDIRQGGLAIYGGIMGAVAGLGIYAWRKKYNLLALMDVCAGSLALGQAIGRWGNFFNQEAHGALVENPSLQFFPYAVYLDSPKGNEPIGWYQATFFYESMWCLIIFAVLAVLFFKQKYHGQLTLMYLALYGFERGIVEWLRTDQLQIGGVPVSAILSIVLFIGAVTLMIIAAIKKYQQPIVLSKADLKEENENEKPDNDD